MANVSVSDTANLTAVSVRRTWIFAMFAVGFTLFLAATVLAVVLQHKLIMIGPLTCLGLTGFDYLAALWCLTAALLGLLLSRRVSIARRVGNGAAIVVDLLA